jgi:hypothetical protein
MKKISIAFIMFLFSTSWAQVKISEPVDQGTFVYVDNSEGSGIGLEKVTARATTSTSIKGDISTLTITGGTSIVQIKKQDIMQFVYRFDKTSSGLVLSDFKLVILTSEKKNRKIITSKNLLNEANSIYPQIIGGLTTSKYGENSVLITANGLAAGNYAFVSGDHDLTSSYTAGEKNVLKTFFAFTVLD